MDVFQAIATRRSVRKFTYEPVDQALLSEILQLAAYAPSAGDARPWSFVVVDRPAVLKRAARINPYADAASQATCGVVVCGDPSKEKHKGFWVQDCAAAANTLLLAAHGKGLGAVWTGIYPVKVRVDAYRQLLALPGDVMPFALVLLGHSDRRVTMPPERSVEDTVFYNIYGHEFLPED